MADRVGVGEVELAYEGSAGTRLPVVLVHGLGGRREVWGDQHQALADAGPY